MFRTLFQLPRKHLNKIVSIFLATYMVLSPILTVGMNSPVFAGIADHCVGVGIGCLSTLQAAIDVASAGDTIQMEAGTFNPASTVNINKSLTIVGSGIDVTIIDASGYGGYGVTISASNVYISELTLQGATTYGFKTSNVNNVSLVNVKAQNSGRSNIDFNGVDNIILNNVQAINTPYGVGIALTDSNYADLSNITTSGNAWGGVALYTSHYYAPPGTSHVTLTGVNSFGEVPGLYSEVGVAGDSIDNLSLIPTFRYKVTNTALPNYIFYYTPSTFDDIVLGVGVTVVDLYTDVTVYPDTTAPSVPVLEWPINDAIINDNSPLMQWADSTDIFDVVSYDYEVKYNCSDENDVTTCVSTYNTTRATSEMQAGTTQDGVYYWHVRATDEYGNTSEYSEYEKLTIDTNAPSITLDLPLQASFINGEIDLQATCNEECDYVNFWWRAEGEAYSNTAPERNYHYEHTNGTVFNWTLDSLNAERWGEDPSYVMPDGNYYFYAAGKDLAGNWARTVGEVMITVDNTAPAMPTGLHFMDIDNSSPVTCGGYSNTHHISEYWDANGELDLDYYQYSSFDAPTGSAGLVDKLFTTPFFDSSWWNIPSEGTYGFQVSAVDLVGNISDVAVGGTYGYTESCMITIDWTAPDVDVTSHNNGDIVNGIVTIEGDVTDTNLSHYWFVIQDDTGTTVAGPGVVHDSSPVAVSLDWNTTVVDDGIYTIKLEARDLAKNKDAGSVEWVTVEVDNTAPVVYITNPSDTDIVSGIVDIKGYVEDKNLSHYNVSVYPGGVDTWDFSKRIVQSTVYTGEFTEQSLLSWDTTALADGEYQIRLAARDLSGNRDPMVNSGFGDSVKVITVIVDHTAPTDPILFETTPEVGIASTINEIEVDWPEVGEVGGASDNLSGVAGYSYDFSQNPTTLPDDSMDLVYDTTVVTSIPVSDGNWYFHIRTLDNAGNWTTTAEHVGPFIIDNTKPEIFLSGTDPIYVIQGNGYVDAGATAVDSIDGVLTNDIVTLNNVNTAFVGTYSVTYNVSDSAGNIADEVTRTVYVLAPEVEPEVQAAAIIPDVLGVEDEENGEVLGLTCDTTETISGYIYVDENDDGKWNEAEEVFEGVEVSITYGDVVEVVKTDENGYWEFDACPAEYEVSIDPEALPEGYSFDGEVLSVEVKDEDVSNTNFEITKDSDTDWMKIILWILGVLVVITVAYRFMTGDKKQEVMM